MASDADIKEAGQLIDARIAEGPIAVENYARLREEIGAEHLSVAAVRSAMGRRVHGRLVRVARDRERGELVERGTGPAKTIYLAPGSFT